MTFEGYNVEIFKNEEFGEIRTLEIDGKPYFVASDIAKALGYKDSTNAIKQHCRWVVKHHIPHPQSKTKTLEVNVIPEGDIYRLITHSELDSAERFESWVMDEVLPSIRKTGGYVNDDDLFINTYFPFADEATKVMFKSTLSTVRKQNQIIEKQKKELRYKEDVIIGLVDDISLSEKRQILNRVVRYNHANYSERWSALYREFENKYHISLQQRLNAYNENYKPKCRNKLDYIDKIMDKVPELYEIATKLYESDIKSLVEEMYGVAS